MAYEHDPNTTPPPRRPASYESASSGWGLFVIALVVAGALAFIFMLLPASDTDNNARVTENAPKIEKPAATPVPTPAQPPAKSPTPPADTPVPSTPDNK
jgi:hypothetical protein